MTKYMKFVHSLSDFNLWEWDCIDPQTSRWNLLELSLLNLHSWLLRLCDGAVMLTGVCGNTQING